MQSLVAVKDGSFCVKTLALLAGSQYSLSRMNASVLQAQLCREDGMLT